MALVNAETRGASAQTVAFEALVAELMPGPLPLSWWEVYTIVASGIFTVNPAIAPFLPASGLFLSNRFRGPAEPLAVSQAGVDNDLRGSAFQVAWSVGPASPAGFPFVCTAVLTLPAVVTPDMAIRFYAVPNAGNANPGPGPRSTVQVTAQFARRR